MKPWRLRASITAEAIGPTSVRVTRDSHDPQIVSTPEELWAIVFKQKRRVGTTEQTHLEAEALKRAGRVKSVGPRSFSSVFNQSLSADDILTSLGVPSNGTDPAAD